MAHRTRHALLSFQRKHAQVVAAASGLLVAAEGIPVSKECVSCGCKFMCRSTV